MNQLWARWSACRDYAVISLGVTLLALGLDWFMAPNHIATGGVTETAVVLRTLWGWSVGVVILAINLPLLAVGFRYLGGAQFTARTIYATLLLGGMVDPLGRIARPLTTNPLIAALGGGALAGVGIALVYQLRGSTGGTDIVALLVKRFTGVQVSVSLMIADGLIVLAAALLINPQVGLYAVIAVLVKSRAIGLMSRAFTAHARALPLARPIQFIRARLA